MRRSNIGILKLRLSIIGTLALIIGVSTLFFTVILTLFGAFNIFFIAAFVVAFNILQWLIAPYLIDAIYRAKEAPRPEYTGIHTTVERLSQRMGLKKPKVMLAKIPIPNAFAYGSPIAGSRVAVTTGLLKELEDEEVEAVLGHELGHLKHRDVQIMMFASVLPAIFYYIGFSLMLSSMYQRGSRNEGGGAVLIGLVSMAIYWVLTIFILGLSRLREYYADRRSAMTVDDGARKLSEALAKITTSSAKTKLYRRDRGQQNSFKALFISDPDRVSQDKIAITRARVTSDQRLVQDIMSRKVSRADRLLELFSTHPNIVKRLKTLQEL